MENFKVVFYLIKIMKIFCDEKNILWCEKCKVYGMVILRLLRKLLIELVLKVLFVLLEGYLDGL